MFARTQRLLLRPGFPEDAMALATAIGEKTIVRHLATAPWPFRLGDAEAFLAAPRDPALPACLVFERTAGAPRLVGAAGLARRPSGTVELGYWIARPFWSRGFATEAAQAIVEIARTLGLTALEGAYFIDNPASGRVLEKLGFADTGIIAPRFSCGRGKEAASRLMRLTLGERTFASQGVDGKVIELAQIAA